MEGTHNEVTITTGLPALAPHNDSSSFFYTNEKQNDSGTSSVEIANEKVDAYMHEDGEPEYRNGVQVIQTGLDVSRFVVDIRDDGDQALTFRSILLGTVFAGMGAALCQASTHQHHPRSRDAFSVDAFFLLLVPAKGRSWRTSLIFSSFIRNFTLQCREVNYFGPDLLFQACANVCVYGIFALDYLLRWERMGEVLPSAKLGRWHPV